MVDPTRRTQIITLLQSRDDHLPQPTRRDHSPAGFIHNTQVRETCPDCFGYMPDRVGCETCKSRGYIEYLRERDPYAVEKVQPYGMTGDRHERRRERDNELSRLERQTAAPWTSTADELAYANQHPEPWEVARDRKWREFDYGSLDRALEHLRMHDQGAYHMLSAVYVYGYVEMCAVVEAAVERGLRFLDARMPSPIRAPEHDPALAKDSLRYGKRPEHEQARERRTARVLRAYRDWGWSTEQIAAHESLSRRRVQQLIAEHNGGTGEAASVASGPAA